MTDFCWPILLADEIGQLYRSSDIRLTEAFLLWLTYARVFETTGKSGVS